jgi:hypothetical protein
MSSPNSQRAKTADSFGGESAADGIFTEAGVKPPPGAQAVSDALSRNAMSRTAPATRKETVRLIDLERRARFGRCGFGAL